VVDGRVVFGLFLRRTAGALLLAVLVMFLSPWAHVVTEQASESSFENSKGMQQN
jgi:hypothetical protein